MSGQRLCVTVLGVINHRWVCGLFFVAAMVFAQSGDGSPQIEQAPPVGEARREVSLDLEEVLDRVSERQRSLMTLRARFQQTRKSRLLLSDEHSSGEFFFRAPEEVRWDYSSPDPMVVLVVGNTVRVDYPDLGKTTTTKTSKRQQRFLSMFAGSPESDELLRQFEASLTDAGSPLPYQITLIPKKGRLKNRVERVDVYVDRDRFLPAAIEYHEQNGDSTLFELRDIEVDSSFPDELFQLDIDIRNPARTDDGSTVGQ